MKRRTVSEGTELENSAKLLPALLARHICTVDAQLQVPCLRGNSRRGKDLVKDSKILLQDMEQLLYHNRLNGLALEEGEVWWDSVWITNSMERVKGTDLQFFHGTEFGRHQMKCHSVKQQAWGKGKDVRCPGSTSLSGGGDSSCSRIWATVRLRRGAPWPYKGKGTKWLFCRSHRSSSWQGLVPQRWHKACYLTKRSRILEQTCYNGPGEGCISLHRMGPAKQSTALWFHWCRFRSNDRCFKALKKVFCLSLKVML